MKLQLGCRMVHCCRRCQLQKNSSVSNEMPRVVRFVLYKIQRRAQSVGHYSILVAYHELLYDCGCTFYIFLGICNLKCVPSFFKFSRNQKDHQPTILHL
jgi:hypothetical protein